LGEDVGREGRGRREMGNGKGGEERRWEENRGEDGSLEGNRRRVRKRDGMGKEGRKG